MPTAQELDIDSARLDGVACLRRDDDEPVRVQEDRRGKVCETDCATGEVFALCLADTCADGAVAVHNFNGSIDRAHALSENGKPLCFQDVKGPIDYVTVRLDADRADRRGRGESPWDLLALLPSEVAIELIPRLPGIREFRMRREAIERLSIGDPYTYSIAGDMPQVTAAAMRRGQTGSGRGRKPRS